MRWRRGRKQSSPATAKAGRLSLERALVLGLAGSAVVFALVAAALRGHFALQIREAREAALESALESAAGRIGDLIGHYAATLELLGKDPEVARVLDQGEDAIEAREQRLAYVFPMALRVKLIGPGPHRPDRGAAPPVTYACIDLAERAIRGERPPIEVHRLGTPDQHIDLARPVVGPRGTAGALLLTLPVEAASGFLRTPALDGYVELRQPGVKGKYQVVTRSGDRALAKGKPWRLLPVPGSGWTIALWPATGAVSMREGLVYWGAFTVGALLVSVLLFVLYRLVAAALRRDQITLLTLLRDAREGELSPVYPAQLGNCAGLLDQAFLLARDLAEACGGPAGAGGGPAGRREAAGAAGAAGAGPAAAPGPEPEEAIEVQAEVQAEIFRGCDIRGMVGEVLDAGVMEQIGRAVGSEARDRGERKIILGHDNRSDSAALAEAFGRGLAATGCDVVDVGRVPTPVVWFAAHYMGSGSAAVVTGGHNPPEYNGLKLMLAGEVLYGDRIEGLWQRVSSGEFSSGEGRIETVDAIPAYLERVCADVCLARGLKVVVDCGNGVAGEVAPQLLRRLGCEVVELYCEVDGEFPNHHPDPGRPENLVALTRAVPECDAALGLAFDLDGDRLGVVDPDGKIVWPDRALMLLAADVLVREPGGKVVYDVECSRHLAEAVQAHGGEGIMWKTGHALIRAKMDQTGAVLGGGFSGHIFFRERWFGFDDGLYAAARLLEVLAGEEDVAAAFRALPDGVATPELEVAVAEGEQFAIIQRLLAGARFPGARLVTVDGIRAEYPEGWGLVRAGDCPAALVLRFEATDAGALRQVQEIFRSELLAVEPELELPF